MTRKRDVCRRTAKDSSNGLKLFSSFTVPAMLDECLEYLEQQQKKDSTFKYEVIVVSDGSKDGTVKVAHSYCKKVGVEKLRVLALVKNRGKGGAVRLVSHFDFHTSIQWFSNASILPGNAKCSRQTTTVC